MVAHKQSWAINGRFLTQPMTGVQRYAFEITNALDAILAEERDLSRRLPMRLVLPPGAETEPALAKITIDRTSLGSGHLWDQLILPAHAGAGVLSLGNFGPILTGRQIVCIHDTNVFIEPESYSVAFRLAYRTFLPLIGKRASRIATVSAFSMDMLVKYDVCRQEKIFIAANGHEHALKWDAGRANAHLLKALTRPYVLLLGSRAKHKNIEVVLRQAEGLDGAGIDIVVVGAASSVFSTGAASFQRPNIHYAGYVNDDDLAALYERAICLAFPSKTEGFGIPPLEAMALGCPVICSNIPSLVEVGGEAAVYVGPDDESGWKTAIVDLSLSDNLRAEMAANGRKRASLFSWKRSAQAYLDEMLSLSHADSGRKPV
jgi:glycosyltransferase involved in cell wall biosynthesis